MQPINRGHASICQGGTLATGNVCREKCIFKQMVIILVIDDV